MLAPFVAVALFQSTTANSIADQTLKFSFGSVGTIPSPIEIIDPTILGSLKLTNGKDLKEDRGIVQMELKLKRSQTKLVEAITAGFEEKKEGEALTPGTFRIKDYAYVISDIVLNRKEGKVEPINTDDSAGQIMTPLGLGLAIFQRALLKPELKKEFALMKDGPRAFSVTYMPNLNANTDDAKGEVAYKFNLKLKDEEGEFPQFFTGAIRFNSKTRLLTYLNATSEYKNTPQAQDEDVAAHRFQSIMIKIETK